MTQVQLEYKFLTQRPGTGLKSIILIRFEVWNICHIDAKGEYLKKLLANGQAKPSTA
jgi:hypothetical protein